MGKHRKKHSTQQGNSNTNNFDLNNFDMSQMGNLLNNIDMSQLSSLFQGLNLNNSTDTQSTQNAINGDRRIELLNAIKPLVDADKSKLIDTMIQVYEISKIMRK